MKRGVGVVSFVLVLWATTVGAEGPIAVSPGTADRVTQVESRCPTFSWGGVEGARSYELVVYRVGEENEQTDPVLARSFAGSVDSWTPSLDLCLERGGEYVWSVRAVGGSQSSKWSSPNLFRVKSGPTELEFEQALAVVQEYLASERMPVVASGAEAPTQMPPAVLPRSPRPQALSSSSAVLENGGISLFNGSGEGSTLGPGDLTWNHAVGFKIIARWDISKFVVDVPLGITGTYDPISSGTDIGAEAYEIPPQSALFPCGPNERGHLQIMVPSEATVGGRTQDSLCYCGEVEDRFSWWCLNP